MRRHSPQRLPPPPALGRRIWCSPMAGVGDHRLAIAIAKGGGLACIPAAMLPDGEALRREIKAFRTACGPDELLNVNFFCHEPPVMDAVKIGKWNQRLEKVAQHLGMPTTDLISTPPKGGGRAAFAQEQLDICLQENIKIISFHFGLPPPPLLDQLKKAGVKIVSTATSLREGQWLQDQGVNLIIAQGNEAGGHRGMFLEKDLESQESTMALVPLLASRLSPEVQIIAAGGITDKRGVLAAMALGASSVQLGTAFMLCPEATTSLMHRESLIAGNRSTMVTSVWTGRPARGLVNKGMKELDGDVHVRPPAFPLTASLYAPLKTRAEKIKDSEYVPMWAGQGYRLIPNNIPASDVVKGLLIDE